MTDLPIVPVKFDFDAYRKSSVAQYKRFAPYEQLAEFARRILKETLNPCLDVAVIPAVENSLIFREHHYE
jgi:hypothetical protein